MYIFYELMRCNNADRGRLKGEFTYFISAVVASNIYIETDVLYKKLFNWRRIHIKDNMEVIEGVY